jgi:5-methylcytosine-specific restriction protein A
MPRKPPSATGTRQQHRRAADYRRRANRPWRKLYGTARWQRTAQHQLTNEPLCATCLAAGRITPATVCDHVDPESKRTVEGFFEGPFQSLCDQYPWRCHSRVKQLEERGLPHG